MNITTVGIDLAKNVFQVHGVDERGKTVLTRQLRRAQVLRFFATLEPCLIGMEACSGSHYWGRKLQETGHTVRLMAPQFVKPYVKTNKHDRADAQAICEAVRRPTMRFVALKTPGHQAVLCLHRARQGFVKARTAQANQIRGLLAEYGVVVAQGITRLRTQLPLILADAENGLPDLCRDLIARLWGHFGELDRQVRELQAQLLAWHRENESSQQLAQIPGIGPLGASALVASIGDARTFRNGRQLAAWAGLVPRQHSSGGKQRLLGISKRGDVYLRTLLIHGARSAIRSAQRHPGSNPWVEALLLRRPANVVAVALANKTMRVVWALLAHHREYRSGYVQAA